MKRILITGGAGFIVRTKGHLCQCVQPDLVYNLNHKFSQAIIADQIIDIYLPNICEHHIIKSLDEPIETKYKPLS